MTVTFTHDQLVLSPLNVRFNEEDANAVEALCASIVAEGLLQPLIVHAAPDGADWITDDQEVGVLAGGRRYRAIRLGIERGDLPATFPIACDLRNLTDAEIVMLSLSENLLRRDLQQYEVHAAIAKLRALNMNDDQIAHHLGQEPDWVKQQGRLGELHPPIFEAYCAGRIDLEQARAFAATQDVDLQAAAWDHFERKQSWERSPKEIRAFYKVGDHRLSSLLRFVGEEAYRDAGGCFELDLFCASQDHRGRVEDEDLLNKLAEVKLQLARAAIREQAGWRDLKFSAEPPQRVGYADTATEIYLEKPADLVKEVPEGTPDSAIIVTIEIARTGTLVKRFWWASRKAKNDAERAARSGNKDDSPSRALEESKVVEGSALSGWDKEARKVARDEHGLTGHGVQVMRSQRRDLLRMVLLQDANSGGNLARDYLVYAQLRQLLTDIRGPKTGIRRFATAHEQGDEGAPSETKSYLQNQEAGQIWKGQVEYFIACDFMKAEDTAEGFAKFVELSENLKSHAAAVLAGLLLLRTANTDGFRAPIHDKIAELAGADARQLRRFWKPADDFAALFPKMRRLELVQPFVEAQALKSWTKHDEKTACAAVAHVLEEQLGWVHPLISFDFEGFNAAKVETEELEAAE